MVGQLRRGASDWWITHFKDLRDRGLCCDASAVHVESLLFCYMEIIREGTPKNGSTVEPASDSTLNKEQQFSPWSILSLVPSSFNAGVLRKLAPESIVSIKR